MSFSEVNEMLALETLWNEQCRQCNVAAAAVSEITPSTMLPSREGVLPDSESSLDVLSCRSGLQEYFYFGTILEHLAPRGTATMVVHCECPSPHGSSNNQLYGRL